MQKLDPNTDGKTMDIVADNIAKLKALLPEIVTEGKVNLEVLKEVLGEYVEDREERYSFTWNGKSRARMLAQTPSNGTLRPCLEESVNFNSTQNIFIEGDNLETLKLLQKSYYGMIDMVYIDPPYNTGNDFVYQDSFADNINNYLHITGQMDDSGKKISTNTEFGGRYHTNWLNMIFPRLKLSRNLLKEDGVIFISIDDNEVHNLKKVCDEVFGEECFVGQVAILCNPKGRSQDKYLATCHEYLLIYAKSILEKGKLDVLKSAEEIEKDYPLKNEKGVYRELELRNTHREFGKHNRPKLFYPFYADVDGTVHLENRAGRIKILPMWDDGFEGCWTWGKDKAGDEIDDLAAKQVRGNWKVYRNAYPSTKQLKSIWSEKKYHTEKGQKIFNNLFDSKEKIFQAPKSLDVILDAITMSTEGNGIILDFFAGSGTTAHAVFNANLIDHGSRRFILCQLPEPCGEDTDAYKAGYETIADICKERIRKVLHSITLGQDEVIEKEKRRLPGLTKDQPHLDLGFKVFKLDSSNIKPWDADFDNYESSMDKHIINIKPDRSEEDVLYEILLKYGLDLTLPIEERAIADKKVFIVGLGALVLCLANGITLDVVEGIADLKEEFKPEIMRVVFKDNGFRDDVVKTNSIQILRQHGITDVKSL